MGKKDGYYKIQWGIKPICATLKEELSFDPYQVRTQRSIERSVLLFFVTASLAPLLAWLSNSITWVKTFGMVQNRITRPPDGPILWVLPEYLGKGTTPNLQI